MNQDLRTKLFEGDLVFFVFPLLVLYKEITMSCRWTAFTIVNPACPVKFMIVKGNAHFTGEL
jgi:hypothetical protein